MKPHWTTMLHGSCLVPGSPVRWAPLSRASMVHSMVQAADNPLSTDRVSLQAPLNLARTRSAFP